MKKIFISGAVTGMNYERVKARFANKEQQLFDMGYQVYNPLRYVKQGTPWNEAMCICIPLVLKSEMVYMLHGYEKSNGALFELETALRVEKEVLYEPLCK